MSTARSASSSSAITRKIDGRAREFFWGITLSKDKPEHTWTLKEEDDDSDFLEHTLFLRHAVLGAGVASGQKNLICVETQDYTGSEIKQPLFALTDGKLDMCLLDINFGSEQPVTFKLVEGEGPVHLSAQHLVEFPPEELDETETEYTATEDEEYTEDGESAEEESEGGKGKKRKASEDKAGKKKQAKSEDDEDEEEDDEEDDEEESMEDDDEESEVSSPDKKSKKKPAVKSKVQAAKGAKKPTPKAAPAKKAGKKK